MRNGFKFYHPIDDNGKFPNKKTQIGKQIIDHFKNEVKKVDKPK